MGNQSQINTYSSVVKDRLISVHVHVGRSLERLGYRRASYVNLHRRASVRDSARAVCSSVVCLLHAVHRCTVILDRRKPHRLGGTLHRKKKYGSTSGRTFEGAVSWYWSIVHYRPRLFHLFFQEHVVVQTNWAHPRAIILEVFRARVFARTLLFVFLVTSTFVRFFAVALHVYLKVTVRYL